MTWTIQGIAHPHNDPVYDDAVARKSTLLLEAKMLRDQGQEDESTHRFAEAAGLESELAEYCERRGFLDSARMHRYSAAGCWAGAGNFYEALVVCDGLLEMADLPDRLREHVDRYARTLRARRRQWYEEVEQIAATDS